MKSRIELIAGCIGLMMLMLLIFSSMFGLCLNIRHILIVQHNIDLSYNAALISNDLNSKHPEINLNYREILDKNQNGKLVRLTEVYHQSIFGMDKAIFMIITHSFVIGLCLCSLFYEAWRGYARS